MKRLAPLAFLSLTLLVSCSSNPEKRQQVIRAEAQRMMSPPRPLVEYAQYELLPMQLSDEVAAEEAKVAQAERLEELLRERIEPLFETWGASQAGGSGTLQVRPDLAALRIVSGGARFWAGAFAGDSSIDMNLVLVDKESGRVLAQPRISKSSSANAGGWSVGASDRNLLLYVADIAHEYLLQSYDDAPAAE